MITATLYAYIISSKVSSRPPEKLAGAIASRSVAGCASCTYTLA